MKRGKAIDTLEELVEDPVFLQEQIDRLLAWEIFVRYVRGECGVAISQNEMCDIIGTHRRFVTHLLEDVKPRFYAK